MLIAAGGTLVRSCVPPHMLGPSGWHADQIWSIARHVRIISGGHSLRGTATVSVRGSNANRGSQQDGTEHLKHLSLSRSPQPLSHTQHRPRAKLQNRMCALAAAFLWLALAPGSSHAGPEIGKAAPALVLTVLDGATFDLTKLKGRVVLVNYWATWCAPCRKEMPKLNAFYRRYHGRGLEIIGISIDFPRDFQKVQKVIQAVGYPTAVSKALSEDGFGTPKGVPITWVIDGDGKVHDRFIEVRDELLDGIVVPLLPH